jgi:predicted O-methyltransferase YrrM
MQTLWSDVDRYIVDHLVPYDTALEQALAANAEAGLPPIDVSPAQGKFLHLLARMSGAKRILEIGTLGGYSTIWLARALGESGRLVTLEAVAGHAEVARGNIERAGLGAKVDILVGLAAETLPTLVGQPPFDFIFIDADKPSNPTYLRWALQLSRPGTVLVCDNVVRDGQIVDPNCSDPRVQGTQQMFDLMAAEPRLTATAVQTVGAKGWDGFILATVE